MTFFNSILNFFKTTSYTVIRDKSLFLFENEDFVVHLTYKGDTLKTFIGADHVALLVEAAAYAVDDFQNSKDKIFSFSFY